MRIEENIFELQDHEKNSVTNGDMERILTSNKLTCTYLEAIENLKSNIIKYCNNSAYLMEEILKLEISIKNSDIKNLRFRIKRKPS